MTRHLLFLFALLAGCYRIHHIEPQTRPPDDEQLATARVDVTCSTEAPFTMSGQLIGIVVGGADDNSYSKYEPLTPYWMEGT